MNSVTLQIIKYFRLSNYFNLQFDIKIYGVI